MCVFLFSGVIHEYIIYITFKKFSGDHMKFFFLQGLAVLIEYRLKHQLALPKPISFLLTFIFNGITAGYLIQAWLPYFIRKQLLKYSLTDFIIRNFVCVNNIKITSNNDLCPTIVYLLLNCN